MDACVGASIQCWMLLGSSTAPLHRLCPSRLHCFVVSHLVPPLEAQKSEICNLSPHADVRVCPRARKSPFQKLGASCCLLAADNGRNQLQYYLLQLCDPNPNPSPHTYARPLPSSQPESLNSSSIENSLSMEVLVHILLSAQGTERGRTGRGGWQRQSGTPPSSLTSSTP